MKTTFVLIYGLLCISFAFSQNLVPNGGFENITTCPNDHGQYYLAPPWQKPTNTYLSSPDLYNVCNTTGFGVPANIYGYQNTHSGVGHAGIYCFGSEWREYLQIQLTNTLSPGVKYEVRMYVSPSELTGIGVNRIGMYISTGSVSGTGSSWLLPFVPQISHSTNSIITDTLNWTLVSGLYTAVGGENYITIGNFFDDAHTDTLTFLSTLHHKGYLKLDDVSLSIANFSKIPEQSESKPISIYPNPFIDKINLTYNDCNDCELFIYDVTSNIVLYQKFVQTLSITTELLSKGIYYYEIRNNNRVVKYGKTFKSE